MNDTNQELSQYHTDLCAARDHLISLCRVWWVIVDHESELIPWESNCEFNHHDLEHKSTIIISLNIKKCLRNNLTSHLQTETLQNCCSATRFRHLTTTMWTQFSENCKISWDMNQSHIKLTETLSIQEFRSTSKTTSRTILLTQRWWISSIKIHAHK